MLFLSALMIPYVAFCMIGSPSGGQDLTVEDVLRLPKPPADYRVSYGSEPSHFGDLRLPEGQGPHPVAVVIHGGCWQARYGLDHLSSFCAALTRAGVATWSIEYRRLGNAGGGWPGTFEDVARGARAYVKMRSRFSSAARPRKCRPAIARGLRSHSFPWASRCDWFTALGMPSCL